MPPFRIYNENINSTSTSSASVDGTAINVLSVSESDPISFSFSVLISTTSPDPDSDVIIELSIGTGTLNSETWIADNELTIPEIGTYKFDGILDFTISTAGPGTFTVEILSDPITPDTFDVTMRSHEISFGTISGYKMLVPISFIRGVVRDGQKFIFQINSGDLGTVAMTGALCVQQLRAPSA